MSVASATGLSRAENPPAPPAAPAAQSTAPTEEMQEKFNGLILAGYEKEAAGDFAAAVALYDQAVAIREDTPTVFVRRAFCEIKLGRITEGALDLKRATDAAPRTTTDYSTMAWFYATCPFKQYRDGSRAVALAQKLMTARPSPENADLLAAGYAQMGNFQQARNVLSNAIKLYPDSPRIPVLQQRLDLYNQKKKYEENWGQVDEAKLNEASKKPKP
jgi:tetratricopeptide (TPR) repeat protein